MKVSFVIPDETLDAAVALFAMNCKKAEEKAELNEALAKAKQADIVEVPRDFLYDNSDDADAMYFAFAFAALATFLKKD